MLGRSLSRQMKCLYKRCSNPILFSYLHKSSCCWLGCVHKPNVENNLKHKSLCHSHLARYAFLSISSPPSKVSTATHRKDLKQADIGHSSYANDNRFPNTVNYAIRGQNIYTIPNALTLTRILLTPVIGYLVLSGNFIQGCALFIFAGLTDLLDGFIARRYPSQLSALGSFLDPLADKFLVSVLFIALTAVKVIPLYLTLLVLTRDVLLVTSAFYVRFISLPRDEPVTLGRFFDVTHATVNLRPTFLSKLNTVLQLGLISCCIAASPLAFTDHALLQLGFQLTAISTVLSGLSYIFTKNTYSIYMQAKSSLQSKGNLPKT